MSRTRFGLALAATVAVGLYVGHITIPAVSRDLPLPPADVVCYEDGSCDDGYCDPTAICMEPTR